jgi:hypothetical protein
LQNPCEKNRNAKKHRKIPRRWSASGDFDHNSFPFTIEAFMRLWPLILLRMDRAHCESPQGGDVQPDTPALLALDARKRMKVSGGRTTQQQQTEKKRRFASVSATHWAIRVGKSFLFRYESWNWEPMADSTCAVPWESKVSRTISWSLNVFIWKIWQRSQSQKTSEKQDNLAMCCLKKCR